MARIVEVDASMLDDVYDLVSRFDDPPSREAWGRALAPSWYGGDTPAGFAVVDHGRMTGFMGTLFVDRLIDGRTERFANLHGAIVRPGHEAHGLRLIMHVHRLTGVTLTTFTPVPTMLRFVTRLGFTAIEDRMRVLYPTPRPRRSNRSGPGLDVLIGADAVRGELDDAGALRLAHHDDEVCHHLLLRQGRRRCHVVFTRVDAPVGHGFVLHVGDPHLFVERSHEARRAIMAVTGTRLVAVDARLLRGLRPPSSVDVSAGVRRMVRPRVSDPYAVDNLYTELSVLNSSGLPTVRHELRNAVLDRVDDLPPTPRRLALSMVRSAP